MNQAEIIDTIHGLKQKLQKEYHVSRIGLFGSVLTDNFSDTSDVDVLVDIDPRHKSYETMLGLKQLLRRQIQREIDLVFSDTISPIVKMHIGDKIIYV